MKRLFFLSLIVFTFHACCKEACMDQGLMLHVQNMQAVDTDTVFLIKYKAYTRFNERIDTVKKYAAVPAGSTLPSAFTEILDYNYDWKIVIPALNKEYFISYIITEAKPCACEGGSYRAVANFQLNNTRIEGSNAVLN